MPDPFAEDPSLVHHVDLNVPGTHVIALGIGHYDHLPGGGNTPTRHHLNLTQLSSPPISARKVAAWFVENFDCAESPLASVSLVLSEPQPAEFTNKRTNRTSTVPTGTMEEVRAALKAWMQRAEVDPRSRVILYFSGHGLSEGLQNLYLLRDYGKDSEDPLLGALNYQNFIAGLATRKPSSQFFLFDACRSVNPIAALNRNGGQGVFGAELEGRNGITQPMQQSPIFSTEIDRQALGRANEESLCARAFIRAMSGACSKREGNCWYVTTDRIVEALTDFQNREAVKGKAKQCADANSFAKIHLRRLAATPWIPVFVRLDDLSMAPKVRITAVRGGRQPEIISDPSSAGWQPREEWESQLELGEYKFLAEHIEPGNAGIQPITRDDTVCPIYIEVTLEVSQWRR
ncbi:MAG: caspase family protein [Bradyrhizobium sp.]